MKYLVATFKIAVPQALLETCRDLLIDQVAEAGFEAFEETEDGFRGYAQKDLFDKQQLDDCLASFSFPAKDNAVTYKVEDAEDKDWNQEWEEQGFEPICVDDQIVIYDAKHPDLHPTTSADHIEIGIEAQLAFGTGNHETTRMIVSTLLNMNCQNKRVLDCGTGTGILGLVCAKLGASDIVGYDIDQWSVDNAKHNATLNGVGNMEVFEGNASVISHISGLFDIVLANINRNILLADMKAFRNVLNEGGYLILSGFYEEDVPLLLEKAEELGLRETGRRTEDNWCCLLLTTK